MGGFRIEVNDGGGCIDVAWYSVSGGCLRSSGRGEGKEAPTDESVALFRWERTPLIK